MTIGLKMNKKIYSKDVACNVFTFSVSIKDYYLDKQGNTIHKNDGNSHIEIKCN